MLQRRQFFNSSKYHSIYFPYLFSPLHDLITKPDKIIWDPEADEYRISPHGSPGDLQSILDIQADRPRVCPRVDEGIEFTRIEEVNLWGLEDYAKAGKLLHRPPMPVVFIDEHEMKKVFSLIYDVFRCKSFSSSLTTL